MSPTHWLKTTEATGAAQVHLGLRAQAVAPLLRERYRLTTRRACGGLEDGSGSDLRPGGLVQVIQRCASRLATEEDRRLEAPRSSGVQRADETSWWVAQPECGGQEGRRRERRPFGGRGCLLIRSRRCFEWILAEAGKESGRFSAPSTGECSSASVFRPTTTQRGSSRSAMPTI